MFQAAELCCEALAQKGYMEVSKSFSKGRGEIHLRHPCIATSSHIYPSLPLVSPLSSLPLCIGAKHIHIHPQALL